MRIHPDVERFNIETHLIDSYLQEKAVKEWGVFGWMGQNYGDFLERWAIDEEIAAAVARIGDQELVATYWSEAGEMNDPTTFRSNVTVADLLQSITESKYFERGSLEKIKSVKELEVEFANHTDRDGFGLVSLRTVEEQRAWESEERRKRLENTAKCFASEKKIALDSLEFIRAVEEEIEGVSRDRESWNSSERRMEEWAAHSYVGGGSESYFDDVNYVNDGFSQQADSLRGMLEYLRSECPLLMAKYDEAKLSGKWAEETVSV